MIRVLVVDDSIFMRRIIVDAISQQPDMEVCGTASNGREAIQKAEALKPQVVTMDIEMPIMNGIQALRELMQKNPLPIIMFSTLTKNGAEATVAALEMGATDFICKPDALTGETLDQALAEIISKIRTSAKIRCRPVLARRDAPKLASVSSQKTLVIASSTGGPKALITLFESLPKSLQVPCLIVQHMPAGFTKSLADRLNRLGAFEVREAAQDDQLRPGLALLAPGGKHMTLANANRITLVDGPERNGVKPCADYLFESAAKHLGSKTVGVILTGMGRDGTQGAGELKRVGATVLGESQQTCVVYGMPKSAKEAGFIDGEFAIDEMGAAIVAALTGGKRAAA